jgi:hypothetical protein
VRIVRETVRLGGFLVVVLIEVHTLVPLYANGPASGPHHPKHVYGHVLTKPVGLSGSEMVTCWPDRGSRMVMVMTISFN